MHLRYHLHTCSQMQAASIHLQVLPFKVNQRLVAELRFSTSTGCSGLGSRAGFFRRIRPKVGDQAINHPVLLEWISGQSSNADTSASTL